MSFKKEEVEGFLEDDFFDKDIQDQIRKDTNISLDEKIETKKMQIEANENKIINLPLSLLVRTVGDVSFS